MRGSFFVIIKCIHSWFLLWFVVRSFVADLFLVPNEIQSQPPRTSAIGQCELNISDGKCARTRTESTTSETETSRGNFAIRQTLYTQCNKHYHNDKSNLFGSNYTNMCAVCQSLCLSSSSLLLLLFLLFSRHFAAKPARHRGESLTWARMREGTHRQNTWNMNQKNCLLR